MDISIPEQPYIASGRIEAILAKRDEDLRNLEIEVNSEVYKYIENHRDALNKGDTFEFDMMFDNKSIHIRTTLWDFERQDDGSILYRQHSVVCKDR